MPSKTRLRRTLKKINIEKYILKKSKNIKQTRKQKKKNKIKKCKKFCKKVFLPERERVEKKFSKNFSTEFLGFDPNELRDIDKGCNDIYCQRKCKNKKKWVKSISKKRKKKLEKQGAMSGCRDLIQEFPDYYKNI